MTKTNSKKSQTSSAKKQKSLLTLPKEYLSWSQIDLWNRNKPEYIQRYFHGKRSFTNQAMEYGKKFATAMETGETDDDIILQALSAGVPRFEIPEYELKASLQTEWGEIPLLGYVDSAHEDPSEGIREYKTGQHAWTQRKVDSHGQLSFYALMIYINYKKVPNEMFLDWIETMKREDGEITATGKIVTFETRRQIGDILEMTTIIKRTASEISGAYTEFLKSLI